MWIFLQGSRNAFVLECGVCVGVKRSTGGVRAADWACCVIRAGRAQQVKGARRVGCHHTGALLCVGHRVSSHMCTVISQCLVCVASGH